MTKKIEINANQIKKGDKLTVEYYSQGVNHTLEGEASILTWRGWSNSYGVPLIGNSNYEKIMREVEELPTEHGSIITVKDHDFKGKILTATAILHYTGVWYYFANHKGAGYDPAGSVGPDILQEIGFEVLRRGY